MIRVGQIRTDPNDGEVIRILSVNPLTFQVIKGYRYARNRVFGPGFTLEDIMEYWSIINETENVTNILKKYGKV